MAQQIINNGTFDNDPSAEKIRTAFDKTNANFTELYDKGYKVIASNIVDSSAVTGTTAITTIETFTIQANTFQVGDRILFRARIIKTGTNGVFTHRHKLGNDGSPQISVFFQTQSNTNLYSQVERLIIVKSATATEAIVETASASSSNGGYLANDRVNIDWTIPQDLTIALNNNSASDSSLVSFWELIRLRG